ncbi:MAG: hypothetical protein ACOCP9_00270 [Halofilum sp. (in: g-proteobacteria)]
MFRFPRRTLLMLFLVILPIGPAAAGSAIVPFEPETVTAPDRLDAARVDRAVVEGFVIRGWRITEVDTKAGTIDAELPVRAHLGRVRARIDDGEITFAYRDSENIDHGWLVKERGGSKGNDGDRTFQTTRESSDDVEAVHRNYLAWVNELARTIDGTLMLAEMETDG